VIICVICVLISGFKINSLYWNMQNENEKILLAKLFKLDKLSISPTTYKF